MIYDRHPELQSKWDKAFWARGYYVETRKMKEELRKQPTWDEIMERIEKLTCPEDKER